MPRKMEKVKSGRTKEKGGLQYGSAIKKKRIGREKMKGVTRAYFR
jgi:hypothetical protein